MALPSEVLALVVGDLSAIGVLCPPGQALQTAIPGPHEPRRMVFSWPTLEESPDDTRPGSQRTPALLSCTFRFDYLISVSFAPRYPAGRPLDASDFACYDTGSRLRALFLGACATRTAGFSVTVQGASQNVASADSAQTTIGGSFSLAVRFEDDSHLSAYAPLSGPQAGQDRG